MNPIKIKWDLLIIILAVYNCVCLPIELAILPFIRDNPTLSTANSVIDLIFFTDMIINFRTTFVNQMTGDENHNQRDIAINYLSGKFLVDLISTIPFDELLKLILHIDDENSKNFILFSCLKLFRILRLTKIIDFMKSSDELKLQLKFFKLVFFLILYIHLSGCTWFFVCTLENDFN